MNEYQKIKNVYEYDTAHRTILGFAEPFKTLKDITWEGTEKVDGTNGRVYWDGHSIAIGGRTDSAQLQPGYKELLNANFSCVKEAGQEEAEKKERPHHGRD